MASTYPTTLDALSTTSANSTPSVDTHPALHNDANDAINAIQGTLGTNPQGAEVTVAERLDAIEDALGGGGGTKTLARFTAADNQPPESGFATLDTRNSILVLDFDAGATESAVFVGVVPHGADLSSGILVRIHFAATSATSGNVKLRADFERMTTDIDSDSFDTATDVTVATNATSGVLTVAEITCTAIDGLTAGDAFRVRVRRVGADGADTMSDDLELVAVELRQVA